MNMIYVNMKPTGKPIKNQNTFEIVIPILQIIIINI